MFSATGWIIMPWSEELKTKKISIIIINDRSIVTLTFVCWKYRIEFPVVPIHEIFVNGHSKRMRNAWILFDDFNKWFSWEIAAADIVATRIDPIDTFGNVIDGHAIRPNNLWLCEQNTNFGSVKIRSWNWWLGEAPVGPEKVAGRWMHDDATRFRQIARVDNCLSHSTLARFHWSTQCFDFVACAVDEK